MDQVALLVVDELRLDELRLFAQVRFCAAKKSCKTTNTYVGNLQFAGRARFQ